MASGGLCVTLDGVCLMPKLPAYNLAIELLQELHQVSVCACAHICVCVCVCVCVYTHVMSHLLNNKQS